jgi:hypothetical protein
MTAWADYLHGDPLPWLLDESDPAVRHLALRRLLDLPDDDPMVADARSTAMGTDPIAAFLAAQNPEGWWSSGCWGSRTPKAVGRTATCTRGRWSSTSMSPASRAAG